MSEDANSNNNCKMDPVQCRGELRERFLWAATWLAGKKTTIDMMDNIKVTGIFRGIDKDVLQAHIDDLETPTVTHSNSLLRLTDCLKLDFEL